MTKAPIILAGLFLIGSSCIYASGGGERIKGNGDKIISDRTVSSFNEIEINHKINEWNNNDGKGTIRIHSSQEYRVSVRIDSNLDEYVEVSNEDNLLKIEVERAISKDFIVDVYCPHVLGITINSIGRVEFADNMITPSLRINIDGAGKVKGAIDCGSFFAEIDGAGDIEISGSSNEALITIDGAGVFKGYEFKINNGTFDIDGAGSIKCWVVDNITADISGVGSIRYRGDPNINWNRSGLGSIKKEK
jgi:hypothetical protein